MDITRKYPPRETRDRIRKWCDLQERAHSEVRTKLRTWGVYGDEIEQIIAELISANYLNEERFASAFARGKFRMKGWGWKKIEQHLKQKGVASYSINRAKEEIEPEDYLETLTHILQKKAGQIKDTDPWTRRQKLLRYAYGRGYQMQDIDKVIDKALT